MSTRSHLEIRKRRRNNDDIQQQMTPMIDVVFQLLIFFIVTLQPADIFSNLAASRLAPQKIPVVKEPELLTIGIFDEHYLLNDKNVTLDSMDTYLTKLGSISASRGVIVKCAPQSSHARLIQVLNLCEKTGFDNISLFSY